MWQERERINGELPDGQFQQMFFKALSGNEYGVRVSLFCFHSRIFDAGVKLVSWRLELPGKGDQLSGVVSEWSNYRVKQCSPQVKDGK